ncbi:YncE family protein [Tenacibaculum soleae]|uniref:YncE family protein n=1 Tax=Tenacibaculum soleae TaxID=447689 RepID=UPI0026E4683B|nr:DUF5074 domain-containing protein [Tenacibaculum soleae]MDO6812452.1 cell surface protein [Tenacibaculum soleae]
MKITKLILQLFLVSILVTSCSDNEKIVEVLKDEYTKGIIISAEGNFEDKDGSISYVSNDLTESHNFIYAGKNGALLGGLIQSITFTDTEAYVILNDVNTIVVADRYTFEKKGQITTDLKNPRYMTIVNGKGYVTNWGETKWGDDIDDDYVTVINLNTLEVDSKIDVAIGPEQILNKNNKLYISHKGAYGSNNIVSVVDLNANNSISTITVDDNPDEMVFDNAGNLIVLSEGNTTYDADFNVVDKTTSAISFIDLSSNTISKKLEFPSMESAAYMTYQNGKVYYYKGADSKVYTIDESATVLATEGIDVGGIYGMNVRDNNLFTVSYEFSTTTTLSKFKVHDLNTKSEVYTSLVGIGASKIYFNN